MIKYISGKRNLFKFEPESEKLSLVNNAIDATPTILNVTIGNINLFNHSQIDTFSLKVPIGTPNPVGNQPRYTLNIISIINAIQNVGADCKM